MLPPPAAPQLAHSSSSSSSAAPRNQQLRSSFVGLRRRGRSTSSSSSSRAQEELQQQLQLRQRQRQSSAASAASAVTTIPLATHSELCLLGLEPLFSPPPSKTKRPKHHHHNNQDSVNNKVLRRKQPLQQQQLQVQQRSPSAAGAAASGSGSLSSLPNEMILRILSHLPVTSLPSVCRVSRRLSALAEDESLWSRVDAHSRTLTHDSVRTIFKRNPTALRLARASVVNLPPSPPKQPTPPSSSLMPPPPLLPQNVLLPLAGNLRYLDVSLIECPPWLLASLLRSSPNLAKLSLENATLSNEVVAAIPTAQLDTLNLALAGAADVDPNLIASLFKRARRLVSVNVSWLRGVKWTGEELKAVLDAMPKSVAHLNVAGFRDALSDEHLVSLLLLLGPGLVDLDISDSPLLTSLTLESLIELCPQLEHVGLSRCYSITPSSFKLLASVRSLRSLDIFTLLKEPSLKHLAETHLPHVQVNSCPLSSIARPTVGNKRSSIWNQPVLLKMRTE